MKSRIRGACARWLVAIVCASPALGQAATKYWIGPVNGAVSTNAYWSTTAGSACGANANTTAPDSSDVATFTSDCTNSARITTGAVLAGIDIRSGFTGTLTQNTGVSVMVNGPYTQAAGTFAGADAAVTLHGTFGLSGGTFISTSGTLTAINDITVSGGTFSHHNGTVQLTDNDNQSLNVTGSLSLYNLTMGGNFQSVGVTLDSARTLTVNHTLNFASTLYYGKVATNGGNIAAKGDVMVATGDGGATGTTVLTISGTGTQTLTGGGATSNLLPLVINKPSGTLNLVGTISTNADWTYTAGTVDPGTSNVQLTNNDNQSVSVTGSQNFYNLTLGGNFQSVSVTIDSATTLTVNHTLNFASTLYYGKVATNGGNIAAKGDVMVATGDGGATGTTVLTISGTGTQTLTGGGATSNLLPLVINKPSGTLNLVGTISTNADWTYTAGTVDPGTSNVQLTNNDNQSLSVTGSQNFYNLTLGGNFQNVSVTVDPATTLTVRHTLNFASTLYYGKVLMYGGNIAAKGDVVVATGDGGATGTTVLTMSGTGTQTLTGGGTTSHLLPLVIDKPSGTLNLVGTISTNANWT